MPDWSKANIYNVGGFQVAEFPLVYNKKLTVILGQQTLSETERKKVLSAKMDKVVLIKSPNGNIDVRIMDITPTYNYLANKSFDISNNKTNKLDSNFSGVIQIRKWNEKAISTRLIENGIVKYKMKARKYSVNTNGRPTETYYMPDCPEGNDPSSCTTGHDEAFFAHVCFQTYTGGGDDPTITTCSHQQGENTFVCNYYVCTQQASDCSSFVSGPQYDDCMCQYYDIAYCGNGGGGEDNTNENIFNPCDFANSLEQNAAIKSIFTELRGYSENIYNNSEKSYYGLINADGTLTSNTVSSSTNGGEILNGSPLPVGFEINFLTHNHNFGNDAVEADKTYNIFSPTDMVELFKYASNNNIGSSFFYGLTVYSEQYMLMIENKQAFIDFMMEQFDGEIPIDFDAAVLIIEAKYINEKIKVGNDDNSANERKFLNFFKSAGLKFFRNQSANNNFNNWKPKKIDPNDPIFIINDPCN